MSTDTRLLRFKLNSRTYAERVANHLLSTFRGQAGILMAVHSVLRKSLCLATSAFPVRIEWTTS
jgi:hypothetical protein